MVRLLENEPGREYDYSVAAYRFLLQLDDAAKIYREETGILCWCRLPSAFWKKNLPIWTV